MSVPKIFCFVLFILSVSFAQSQEDGDSANVPPNVQLMGGKLRWTLDDATANHAYDFLKDAQCAKYGNKRKFKRAPPTDEITADILTEDILSYLGFGQDLDEGALVRVNNLQDVALVVQGQLAEIPEPLEHEIGQALANALAIIQLRLRGRVQFLLNVAIARTTGLLLTSLIRQCYHFSAQKPDTFRVIDINIVEDKMDFTKTCPAKDYDYSCADEECDGKNGACQATFLKGCKCQDYKNCPTPDIRPLCRGCGGADGETGLCRGTLGATGNIEMYRGCECDPDIDAEFYQPFDEKTLEQVWEDIGQGNGGGPTGPNPACNGLKDNWSTPIDFENSVNLFCGDEANRRGNPNKKQGGTLYDRIELEVVWPKELKGDNEHAWDYTFDDCKKSLMVPVDDCDGNDPANVGNIKGGGIFTDDRGVTHRIQATRNDQYQMVCAGWGGKAFMSHVYLDDAVEAFATEASAVMAAGKDFSYSALYHEKTVDEVRITGKWTKSLGKMSKDSLKFVIQEINVGCDYDMVLNQFFYKWGGTKSGREIDFGIFPQTSRRPMTQGDNYGSLVAGSTNSDTGRNGKKIDKAVLQMCLASMYDWRSGGKLDCGGKSPGGQTSESRRF